MYIIPAIDVIDGKCVRLTQGNYAQKTIYNESPLEVAKAFEAVGIKRLHLVDLDGAKQKKVINLKVLEQIATQTHLHIDFGGGVQTDEDLRLVLQAGAKQITGGSVAVKNPALFEQWLKAYGNEQIILGADVKGEKITVNGWQETSELDIWEFLQNYLQKGIKYVICTDVGKDGMLQGTATELYAKVLAQFPEILLIASGGVASIADVQALKPLHVFGVIVGKAIYEGKISMKEIEQFHMG